MQVWKRQNAKVDGKFHGGYTAAVMNNSTKNFGYFFYNFSQLKA